MQAQPHQEQPHRLSGRRGNEMRDEIDPQLPYIQVHRSVAAMAAQLAEPLKVSYQHVRGALDVFWESLADRRILQRALSLEVPMVVLAEADAANRLWLAFGLKVDVALVVAAGVLEAVGPGKYRVRGMSRYLDAEGTRLRRKATMTGVRPGSDPPPTPPPTPLQPRKGEREEVRGKREEGKGDVHTPPGFVVTAPTTPDTTWTADDFWRWAQSRRQAAGFVAEKHPGAELASWFSQTLAGLNGDIDRLKEAFLSFGDSPYWQRPKEPPALPFRGFMSQTDRFIPRGPRAS